MQFNKATENGVVSFADCSLKEGKTPKDAGKAMNAWGKDNAKNGVETPSWMFYPGPGAGDIDYDFKAVRAYSNYAHYGEYVEYIINGGGMAKARAIFRDVMECGSSRLYNSKSRRQGWQPKD